VHIQRREQQAQEGREDRGQISHHHRGRHVTLVAKSIDRFTSSHTQLDLLYSANDFPVHPVPVPLLPYMIHLHLHLLPGQAYNAMDGVHTLLGLAPHYQGIHMDWGNALRLAGVGP